MVTVRVAIFETRSCSVITRSGWSWSVSHVETIWFNRDNLSHLLSTVSNFFHTVGIGRVEFSLIPHHPLIRCRRYFNIFSLAELRIVVFCTPLYRGVKPIVSIMFATTVATSSMVLDCDDFCNEPTTLWRWVVVAICGREIFRVRLPKNAAILVRAQWDSSRFGKDTDQFEYTGVSVVFFWWSLCLAGCRSKPIDKRLNCL